MFQITMSPKVLNAEKLEKKFASLTKSRESILGLSTWIIRHKEFYKEIVNQWLNALSKDMNALTMFYVANDVIQNCGRKKAPEFREAFSTVLEKAVTLEKVKEIKTEVIRMVTLWHERAIYDATFFKKLQDKLNDVEESDSEEELDEADVIENFKLQNLTDSLRKLKTLENDLLLKEEFIEDVEEPGISNIDNLIVKMDSQKELRKVDKFQKLVEDYLCLADKVMAAQKDAMLNLKYSSIFYSAQLEDAKKVAHAYRIYGKKVKILEKAVTEKLANLPEASPVLEEESPSFDLSSSLEYQSPGLSTISDPNNENSSQSNSFDLSTSPRMNENSSFMNVNILNEKYKSPSAESQNSVSALIRSSNDERKVSKTPIVVSLSNIVKKEENIPKSPVNVESSSVKTDEKISPLIDNAPKQSEKILKSPIVVDASNSQIETVASKSFNSEKNFKSPIIAEKIRRSSTDKKTKRPVAIETVKISIDKIPKAVAPASLENTIDKDKVTSDVSDLLNNDSEEKTLKFSLSNSESASKKKSSLENEEISSNSKEPPQKYGSELQTLSEMENIDFLLEKSYNEQRTKSKASFKRKIDNLLKMKQSKACKLSSDDSLNKNKVVSEASVDDDPAIVSCSNLDHEKEIDVSDSHLAQEESIVNSGNLEDNDKATMSFQDKNKADQPLEMIQNSKPSHSITSDTIPLPTAVPLPNFQDKNKADQPLEIIQNLKTPDSVISDTIPLPTPVPFLNFQDKNKADQPLEIMQNLKTPDSVISDSIIPPTSVPFPNFHDKNKADQSLEVMQNSKTPDSVTSDAIPLTTSVHFPNFPDIPTELLKNILDKHRTNMNQPSNVDPCSVTSGLFGHKPENVKQCDSNEDSVKCSSAANDKDISPGSIFTPALDSKTNDMRNTIQMKSILDNESSTNINKDDSKTDTESISKNHCSIKTTPLMENLQKLLKCFTEKGPAFEELKNSKTLKSLPTYSLRSTLKLYHVLKEHHKNDNALNFSNINNNSMPDIPPETASSANCKSSVCNYNSTNAFTHSKNDNLEIMDMEVDSDDDNTK